MEKAQLKGMFVSGNVPSGAEYKAALQDVLQTFPYFQLAQVLFAKQMYDTHEPEASNRIKLASMYAPDRKAMYQLFKQQTGKVQEAPAAANVSTKPDKGEVKYNFVYSSTTSDNIEVKHSPPKPEEEKISLSEAFIRKELETAPPEPTPAKEPEKKVAELKPKEEKKPFEPPKIQPFISVTPPKDKEVAATIPAKKPYTPPTIEKKKSLYQKKTEPTVPKPLVTITPPVTPGKKTEERKEEQIIPPVKPNITPKPEEKKPIEVKAPEKPVVKPVETPKPPIAAKPPIIEKTPQVRKPEPTPVSGRKPYTPPTIVWKKSLYAKKVEEKKPEIPKAPVSEKPAIEAPKAPPAIVEEKKVVEPISQAPIIEVPAVENKGEIPVIEEKKVEVPVALTPLVIEESPTVVKEEEKKEELENIVIETKVEEKPVEVESTPVVEEQKDIIIHAEPTGDRNLKYSFNSWLKVLPEIGHEKKPEIKPVTQEETANLIDKFLRKEPSISRPKAEFFSPVKAAKMSIAEDDTIVSETLANIYFMQGSYPKALKAYQTLLLQFPEKKNIFAPRIQEIKDLMRENTKPGTK